MLRTEYSFTDPCALNYESSCILVLVVLNCLVEIYDATTTVFLCSNSAVWLPQAIFPVVRQQWYKEDPKMSQTKCTEAKILSFLCLGRVMRFLSRSNNK